MQHFKEMLPVYILLVYTADRNCSLRDLSPSLVEHSRVCGVVSGGGVCYSGDSVGSVAVYFCTDGYSLEGDTTRECLSSGLWNGSTPQCVENIQGNNAFEVSADDNLLHIQRVKLILQQKRTVKQQQ